MKKVNTNFKDLLNLELMEKVILRACKNHNKKPEVKKLKNNLSLYSKIYLQSLLDNSWKTKIKYRKLTRTNPGNGKVREINSPDLTTRIYQHLLLELIEPTYYNKDNKVALNCKPGCGITSNKKENSVIKKLKNIFYDERSLNYYLCIDQRKCYEHIKEKTFRKALKKLFTDKWLLDFAIDVCFIDGNLPIGTPTSPLVHHIVLLEFDYFIKSLTPFSVRYADDNFLAFQTKEEANQAKWRIINFWWYKLGIRAKKHNLLISPITKPLDFCGFRFHRNSNKTVSEHNKGFVTIRKSIKERALKCNNNESWASYFGILSHADSNKLIKTIINMSAVPLSDFTNRLKLERELDYPEINLDDLKSRDDITFTIKDYYFTYSKNNNKPNYVKMVLYFNGEDINVCNFLNEKSEKNKVIIRLARGNFSNIIDYLLMLENNYGKDKILPIKHASILYKNGYIFRDSTNIINSININDEEFSDLFD